MNAYTFPIMVSAIIFPFIAFLSIIPYIIYNYKKYGNVRRFKTFIFYTFVLYIITAFFLTILPLPKVDKPRGLNVIYTQLIPFNFINDIIKETSVIWYKPQTYLHIVKERAFLQAFFNFLLVLPFGIYLRYLFNKDLKKTVLMCFLLSLFFEITQRTGIYGIYKYPYRLFDVDDLILNTLGGLVGFYIEPLFAYVLPNIKDNKPIIYGNLASFTKRILAFTFDYLLFQILFSTKNATLMQFVVTTSIYFILIPFITNGITAGNLLFGIRLKGVSEKLNLMSLIKRYSIIIYGFLGVNKVLTIICNRLIAIEQFDFMMLFFAIQIILNIMWAIHLISHMVKKDRVLVFDKISDIFVVDIK